MEDYPRTLSELEDRLSTEEACLDYLFGLRWPEPDLVLGIPILPRFGINSGAPHERALLEVIGGILSESYLPEFTRPFYTTFRAVIFA